MPYPSAQFQIRGPSVNVYAQRLFVNTEQTDEWMNKQTERKSVKWMVNISL